MDTATTLSERVLASDRRAVARAISRVENGTGDALLRGLAPHLGRARVVGMTGSPGAGKSTLINVLARELMKARDQRVAIVAVDPSSAASGGALLGDRIRMTGHDEDERIFIRSLASRGHLGGLMVGAAGVIDVLDAAGFDTIIVETVGAGQSEVEIASLVQLCIVVCAPGMGDEVQALKAGILEIADVFVVNKADLPGARDTARALRGMLALRGKPSAPPVLKTNATSGDGVAALAAIILEQEARGMSAPPAPPPEPHTDVDAGTRTAEHMAADAYGAHLGIELVEAGPGWATVRMRVGAQHLNFWAGCHGGALFSVADMALGLACNSQGVVTALVDSHLALVAPVKQGDRLTARAVEVSRSRRIGVYRSEVRRDDGTLVATMTGTVYITGKPMTTPTRTGSRLARSAQDRAQKAANPAAGSVNRPGQPARPTALTTSVSAAVDHKML